MELSSAVSLGLDLLQGLIRMDTSVQAGREIIAARLLYHHAQENGLSGRIYEPIIDRGSFLAQLPGSEPASLLLLSHLDTAPLGEGAAWEHLPLSGTIADGQIWGRGAIDCKGLVAVWYAVMLMLRHTPLRRGVVFLAAANEEGGGQWGSGWLSANLPELRLCRWALSEGGGWKSTFGDRTVVTCQTGEKGIIRLHLPPPQQLNPEAFTITAQLPPSSIHLLEQAIGLPKQLVRFMRGRLAYSALALAQNQATHAVEPLEQVYHTCSIRGFSETVLELECRVLPGYRLADIIKIVADRYDISPHQIKIAELVEPTESPLNSELFQVICQTSSFPVAPLVTPSYSDNRWFRETGVEVFGYFPGPSAREIALQHCAGERLSLNAFREATSTLHSLIRRFCS
ncbi:MAG: Acetylornithine deacetylase-related deacylase [Bacillota bacterium]|nr:MAG: Acetylornithine deacetylase-related deacylase [Bacillota bacterium]